MESESLIELPELSPDEWLALNIALEGGSIAAIAWWKDPVDRLVRLGLLLRNDAFSNAITPRGREVWEAFEARELGMMAEYQRARQGGVENA